VRNNWSLVIHEVSQTSAMIWFGTLKSDMRKFAKLELRVFQADAMGAGVASGDLIKTIEIDGRYDLSKPFKGSGLRFFGIKLLSGLQPAACYKVELHRPAQDIGLGQCIDSRQLSYGTFRTLPETLKKKSAAKPLVIALGSCFYPDDDDYAVGNAYQALLAKGDADEQPDIKFLTGDQVYLDIGLDSLSPVYQEVQERIAEDYALAWQRLRKVLRHGGTWMLADDHEYWNNYPHISGWNPYLWMIHASDTIREVWRNTAKDGATHVQRIIPVRQFNIANQISFMIVDVRSHRANLSGSPNHCDGFLPEADFDKLINWIGSLNCPGVLVMSQPLICRPGGEKDRNLSDYKTQYSLLVKAINSSRHDILLLCGDVHYGRISNIRLSAHGKKLHEIIASPMSSLTGIDGRFAASRSRKINSFPPYNIAGIKPQTVDYPDSFWRVSSERVGGLFGIADYQKTQDHFSTLAFSLHSTGQIQVDVKTWLVQAKSRSGKPKSQFKKPNQTYRIIMS